MVNLNASIREAFFERNCFVKYYNLLNTLFLDDRIRAIHDAKTIAVVIACTQLNQTFGFSYPILFDAVEGIFGAQGHLRLSGLVDVSGYEAFKKCVDDIRSEYEAGQEIETPAFFLVEQNSKARQ